MSETRLNITAFPVDGPSPSEVAHDYGVTRSWVYVLLARYQLTIDPQRRYPTRDYQPTGAPKGPTRPKKETFRTQLRVRNVSHLLRDDNGVTEGNRTPDFQDHNLAL